MADLEPRQPKKIKSDSKSRTHHKIVDDDLNHCPSITKYHPFYGWTIINAERIVMKNIYKKKMNNKSLLSVSGSIFLFLTPLISAVLPPDAVANTSYHDSKLSHIFCANILYTSPYVPSLITFQHACFQ